MAETSGVVQRLKWLPSTRILLVEIGPTPTALQLFLLTFETIDAAELARKKAVAHLIGRAFGGRLPVSLFHEMNDALITGVDVRFADIRVDGIEVTQAIQSLNHSVPLIALKSTVARVYLSSRLPANVTVRGTLRIRRISGGTSRTLLSLNSVTLQPAQFGQVDPQRRNIAGSLNFILPTDMTTAGQLVLTLTGLTDTVTNAAIVFAPPGDLVTVNFVNTPPLRLRLVGFSYPSGTPPQTRTPTLLDFGLTISWLQRAYPVAQVLASQAIVPANAAAPFGCGAVNAQLAALRALDMSAGADARTHYYGLVSDSGFFMRGCAGVPSSPDPSAVGSGPTGPATWGWDFDGCYGDWYAGHELGHTFGRLHPGFCGETHDDPSYPFINGQLANADDAYVGFDVGDAAFGLPMAVLPGTDWHDVMTYCSTQWLSSYTYTGIRTRLVAEDALGPGGGGAGRPDERYPPGFEERRGAAERRTLVTVVAEVNVRRGTGRILYVVPVSRGQVTTPDPASPVTIRTRRADGQPLDEVRVPVKPFAEEAPEDAGHALCDPVIAVHPDAAVIELDFNGTVADTLRPAASPPGIQGARVTRATGDTLVLRWDQERRDERHVYNVQVSDDNGRSWQTLAVGLRTPELAIVPGTVPLGRHVLFRVQATDGFRSTETIIEWPGEGAR